MKLKTTKFKFIVIILISIGLIVLGIGLVYNAFYDSYYTLRAEHEKHLQDLAWSTDRNIGTLMRGVSDELRYSVKKNSQIEKDFLNSRDDTEIKAVMENSMLMEKSFISGLQVIENNEIILCTNKAGDCSYSYPYGWTTEAPSICVDKNGNEYFSIITKSQNSDLYYAVLIDLDELYAHITGVELTADYWLVLYDLNTGVLLQNDGFNDRFIDLSVEEGLARNDGISILVQAELAQEIKIENYKYSSEHLADTNHLIAAIPSGQTNNGVFAISVAVGMSHLSDMLNSIFGRMVSTGILILIGLAVLLIIIYINRRSNADLQEKLELLDKENKEMAELAHHQRLEMIGTMTSSIAHEFNNMLTPIMGYSIMLMEKLPPESEELIDELGEIYDASERAKTLISRLSALSRKSNAEKNYFSPDELIEKVFDIAKPSVPPMVEIKKDYHCPEECIFANRTEVGQLLLNIIINAFQAMEKYGGGNLLVSTVREDNKVLIKLNNTGPAIDSEIIPKLFDPFFTTKEVGKGTGLGLAIAKQIAENYGGSISVESSDVSGTTFTVSFPYAMKENK